MPYEPLERLLANVTDEQLESLRDAILREEGQRRSNHRLVITAPHPPLAVDEDHAAVVTRWAKLLTWLASDIDLPPAHGKRGIAVRLVGGIECPDTAATAILLQEALVEAGLLLGRTPEWMDATRPVEEAGDAPQIIIDIWEKPPELPWT